MINKTMQRITAFIMLILTMISSLLLILSFKYIKTALNYRNKKTNIIKDS